MKKILIPFCTLFLLLAGCNNGQGDLADSPAVDKARTYFRTNLGKDADQYEETNWGKVEPRKVDFQESRRYKAYNDTLGILNMRLKEMDDSLGMEMSVHGESPYYNALKMRRDAFQREVDLYVNDAKDLEMRYNVDPEYDGYWIYHEYKVNGEPRKAYILFRDTTTYDAVDVIYVPK